MGFNRYTNDPRINLGQQLGTSETVSLLRLAIKNGSIPVVDQLVLTGADRLDALAGAIYGDARYWWVLAAASDIGWGLQVPPGTVLKVIKLSDLSRLGV